MVPDVSGMVGLVQGQLFRNNCWFPTPPPGANGSPKHQERPGVLPALHKKGGTTAKLTSAQALGAALCFGWLDGRRIRRDGHGHCNRFTPGAARSAWSMRNAGNVERLVTLGLMEPAGNADVEAAKADGRWEAAQEKRESLGAAERYASYYWLHTLKRAETR